MHLSYSDGLNALERYQRVFCLIIVIIVEMRSFILFFFFCFLQLFNISHLAAGVYLVRADPDKTFTLFELNLKKKLKKITKFIVRCLFFSTIDNFPNDGKIIEKKLVKHK